MAWLRLMRRFSSSPMYLPLIQTSWPSRRYSPYLAKHSGKATTSILPVRSSRTKVAMRSSFLVLSGLSEPMMPARRTSLSKSRSASSSLMRWRDELAQPVLVLGQGVAGDVEAEGVHLVGQDMGLVPLPHLPDLRRDWAAARPRPSRRGRSGGWPGPSGHRGRSRSSGRACGSTASASSPASRRRRP